MVRPNGPDGGFTASICPDGRARRTIRLPILRLYSEWALLMPAGSALRATADPRTGLRPHVFGAGATLASLIPERC
jgi:hypothetical protein